MPKPKPKAKIKFWVILTSAGIEQISENDVLSGTLTLHPALGQCFECTHIKSDLHYLYMELPFQRMPNMISHIHIPHHFVMAIIESTESNLDTFLDQSDTKE